MRVLYAALRHDPNDPVASSSVDHGFFQAIRHRVEEVEVLGPFRGEPPAAERALRWAYRNATGKRYIKWDLFTIINASLALNRAVATSVFDVVFTIFPAALAFYRGKSPVVFCTDLTFQAWQEYGAGFGGLALNFLVWLERRAVRRSTLVIVHSEWGRREIVQRHSVSSAKTRLIVMPAAIPAEVVPRDLDIDAEKALGGPIRLLLVGRDYHRKGVDIGLEIAEGLNDSGVPTRLIVCGTSGTSSEHVEFVGPFDKSKPEQLAAYVALYRKAHFLIHPARFEPAGIVPAEAAAFGTPTITNDTGGLATSVRHGVSGVVLPPGSPPSAYIETIAGLLKDVSRYHALCRSTRERYWGELNWEVAGDHVVKMLREASGSETRQS